MKNILTLLGILAFGNLAFPQDIDSNKLDTYLSSLEVNDKFMGSIAVAKNGNIIYSKVIGYLDVANEVKANEKSKYRIGSISKTFTTVLVLKAVEENKINLEQTIDEYFPSIKNSDKITIEDLLYHRSGIHNFTNDSDYINWNTEPKSEQEMVAIIEKAGIDFEPDSKSEYSNSNYVLLTYILEKTFDKSYAELLKEHIAKPLELSDTYMAGRINVGNKECNSYRYLGNWKLSPETDTSIPLGAGGILSTPIDLVKFSNALFSGKLLNTESLDHMKSIKGQFGMGLFQIPFYDKIGYGHTGGIDGFNSVFSFFSDGNISYALTSNGSNFNINDISIAVLSAVYGKPFTIPEFSNYTVANSDIDQYLGVYTSSQISLKITITKEDANLIAQATGQPSFPLEATAEHTFKFDPAGVVMEFQPSSEKMTLKQGGGEFLFSKE
ncbi:MULTISPECIES: serine hydrolase domain-containing protein [Flavobacteriaceae]|uniref:serine hydrolase domain-containing protein n=1 Tax=Flavobacteriaceae TaxID=49546 RepID=UPI0014910B69|nr:MULTISPECIES: serine hydrolase domain-containing protein [Allomuricauda]MDC6364522.1 serine hydrolase [Muricauda sp. AC10]